MLAHALAVATLAAAAVAGVQTWRLHSLQVKGAQTQAQHALELAEAERAARAAENQMADGARKAAQTYATHIDRARTAAGGAAAELDRLRGTLGTPPERSAAEDAAAAAGADDASRARLVVGRCATALQNLAATADACESRLTGLQGWARAVAPAGP